MSDETPGPASEGTSRLVANVVHFVRLLRLVGIQVPASRATSFVRSLDHVELGDRAEFRDAARTTLVYRFRDLEWFDRAFELFWSMHQESPAAPLELGLLQQRVQEAHRRLGLSERDSDGGFSRVEGDKAAAQQASSARERLFRKDFAELSDGELAEVRHLIRQIEWKLQMRTSRRLVRGLRRDMPDMRRIVRRSLRSGGEALLLYWRQAKLKRRPIVLLCDTSGSMDPYSRLLLEFLYAVGKGLEGVEAFAFGTRLTHLTRYLRGQDIDRALREAAWAIEDWGGGTRIGETLRCFNYTWGRRVLSRGAIVIIISDGWDRGSPELLAREMARLERNCQSLIWLNPLLGSPGYEPLSRGIRAALPHVDHFLPVHNLVSLQQLGTVLEGLAGQRPFRYHHGTDTRRRVERSAAGD